MQHDELIGQVQQRARLGSRGEAEQATRAVLETLGARLAGGQPRTLAAQLPPEIGRHLSRHEGSAGSFGREEFIRRVADAQTPGVDEPDAAFHIRAVLSVVDEALEGAQLDDVRSQLTEDYYELFDFEELPVS